MASDIILTRNIFLRCMCAIYMAAFCSLYIQIPGLYGEKGIIPAHTQIKFTKNPMDCFLDKPSLLCFAPTLGLNTSYMMEGLALIGILFSFLGLLFSKLCTSILFAHLWAFYLSLFHVGQTFLWFQWDTLLLDVGFITIFVAPLFWNSGLKFQPRNSVMMFVVRWALFRLMFASGVVKLQSGCPTWWGLTALNVHYESQCIPTPLAWFAHHLPAWWQKLSVVATFIIEIPVPFFFFSPIRQHRLFAFYMQVLLQFLIILSGNYNFFNLLTLALCVSLLDDTYFGFNKIKPSASGIVSFLKTVIQLAAKWTGFGVLLYYSMIYFDIHLSPRGVIESSISFTQKDFDGWLEKAVPISIVIGTFSFLMTISDALTSSIVEVKGFTRKLTSLFSVVCYSAIAFCLVGISVVPFSTLHPPSQQRLWPVFRDWYKQTSDLNIASSYGLFRHMTGVGGRPEVILEGANAMEGPWKEFEFPYKPGKIDRAPPFVAPHQPRVDWQMWFAALGTYHQNPWLISMVHKLLLGEKSVTMFLDSTSPWKQKPPKFIRGLKYTYQYTSFNESSTKNWWKRKLEGEYMPIYTVDHAPLLDYLKKTQLIGKKDVRVKNKAVASLLDQIRTPFNVLDHHLTVFALFVAALIVSLTSRMFN